LLGRWVSCDPKGIEGGINLFEYTECRPTILSDINGKDPQKDGSITTTPTGVHFIIMPLDSAAPYIVNRTSSETFTEAAKKTDTSTSTEVIINAELYGGKYDSSPTNPLDNPAEGFVIKNKIVSPGSKSSPQTFFFSIDAKGNWKFGKGDPPTDSQIGFGGGIPIIIGGLRYGIENKYKSGAPSGLPSTGDPGPGNEKWLDIRSNKGFEGMYRQKHITSNEKGGLTVMGIDRKNNRLVIIVKPNNVTEDWRIDKIRDEMFKAGIEDAIAWDGSSSSTLVVDSDVVSQPASKKDNTIPFGVGFRTSALLIPHR